MSRRRTLRVPDTGVCAGHPCDDCERCSAGDCCGGDVGEAGLPLEGSWPHAWCGRLGVLEARGDRLRCACCGEWHEDLGRHLRSHNLTADAYRALWGLNSTTALIGKRLREVRAENGRLHGHRLSPDHRLMPSGEQRSTWARDREARAETRLRRGQQLRAGTGRWTAPTPGPLVARLERRSDG